MKTNCWSFKGKILKNVAKTFNLLSMQSSFLCILRTSFRLRSFCLRSSNGRWWVGWPISCGRLVTPKPCYASASNTHLIPTNLAGGIIHPKSDYSRLTVHCFPFFKVFVIFQLLFCSRCQVNPLSFFDFPWDFSIPSTFVSLWINLLLLS